MPSKWWGPAFWASMGLIPVMLLLVLLGIGSSRSQRFVRRFKGALRRGISYLLIFVFVFSPFQLQVLADSSGIYSNLESQQEAIWGTRDRTIDYQYDANGSMTRKLTYTTGEATPEINFIEKVDYAYNLQSRLEQITVTDSFGTNTTVYTYNHAGIRVTKDVDAGAEVTAYHIDPANHTGYAQVIEETTTTSGTPDVVDRITYTLGDDVIAQTLSTDITGTPVYGTAEYLLYDGHGSTRQLAANDESILEVYAFDAYGVNLNPTPSPMTSMLYAGEHYDSDAQHYYNRARWYNPANGRFNRTDPFAGNSSDPQSLHKYLYAHANPVNGIDPTGLFTFISLIKIVIIISILGTLAYLAFANRSGKINTVEIYLASEPNSIRKGILEKKSEFESHLGKIVKTKIISGAIPTGKMFGYDSDTKTYRIKVSWNKTQPTLGYTNNDHIALNYDSFDKSISKIEEDDYIKFSNEQKAFLASNVLLHETVHSIYDHDSSWYRGLAQHESTGLMVGFRWLDWSPPKFYDANPDSDEKFLPFSETTKNRLNSAIRK